MSIATAPLTTPDGTLTTTVQAIYLHGPRPTQQGDAKPTPMIAVAEVEALAGRGLHGDSRYLRATRRDGSENLRQVSLIDAGTLARHEARFGAIAWELVKSQIVLAGEVRLSDMLGRQLVFGEGDEAAILELTIKRDPCFAMDLIHTGLREAMRDGEQGALARVLHGGPIRVGMALTVR